ncbi:MAG: sigma-54-dependent Fis family transcriptional regulator [Desulfobacteraceae bacterium]|nr:sigma-54-dependent Fis family transcriptional regulator [Desulfobacteraceae bacterium]
MARVLIVDDDDIFCTPFAMYLRGLGHTCELAINLQQGLSLAYDQNFDIIFLDVVLPDNNGLSGIDRFKKAPSQPEVMIITGHGDSHGAETAIKNGAWDYLEKPPSYSKVKLLLGRALKFREKKIRFREHKMLNREGIVGNDLKLKECLEIVARAASSDGSVFIEGETGTGKELFARAVHLNSARVNHAFVVLDCTNIPANLTESIFFGHEKGAFTGAEVAKTGLIHQAHNGTLFLDEVGDLNPEAQKSLLRVLQEKQFRPLGANVEIDCDFRLVSATNKNLERLIADGRFRKDLYYRLVGFHVGLPPLRERREDIKLLSSYYVFKLCDQLKINTKGVSKDFTQALEGYAWPGNVRELVNTLHAAIVNAGNEPVLFPHFLPLDIRVKFIQTHLRDQQDTKIPSTEILPYKMFQKMMEARYLDELIEASGKNAAAACRLSGMSRSGLYHLLKKHNRRLKHRHYRE